MRHEIAWHTASPLWDRSLDDAGAAPPRFRAPALLRFADDAFAERLQQQLAADPAGLARHVLRSE
ncbi:MAG TPA: hypothetical protein VES39_11945, partial [Rhodospirillales bacterium]|nr:hypothetical protein [Rhodospirillales bacterium]